VNTKIRVLDRRRLTDLQIERILEAPDVKTVLLELRRFGILENEELKTTEAVERWFNRFIVVQFEKIAHFFHHKEKTLFRALFRRYEVEDLKTILRALKRGEPLGPLANRLRPSAIYSTVDVLSLLSVKSVEELVRELQGTTYGEILSYSLDEPEDRFFFYTEMRLDRYYFKELARAIEGIERREGELLQELLGRNADMLNMQWLYRGRTTYRLSPEEILNYTLSGGSSFSYRRLKELCYLEDASMLIDALRTGPYGFLFEGEQVDRFIEVRMERAIKAFNAELAARDPYSVMTAIDFLHRVEFEIRDLFALLEAKRYGLDPETTRPYLVWRAKRVS
jgi:V/A-type H+-transporting ATPase subunit C